MSIIENNQTFYENLFNRTKRYKKASKNRKKGEKAIDFAPECGIIRKEYLQRRYV